MNLSLLDIPFIVLPLVVIIWATIYLRRFLRSVADYLAASRCAGRYLISTATETAGGGIIVMVTAMEMFSQAGFSQNFWGSLAGIIMMFLPLIGLVVYRFRETRALTFHQFFEMRYSKGIRVFSSFLNVGGGLFSYGIQPAIGARFFVYFLGLPEWLVLGGMRIPTFVPIMLALMAVAVFMALSGGQITVIVTDFLEGLISMFFYLVVAFAILLTVSMKEIREALLSGAPGQSYVNPFDISNHTDFNGWYVVFSVAFSLYTYRGYAWNQGFAAAARNAHESKMAGILAGWRAYAGLAMMSLVSVAAFTVLHHPDFAAMRQTVQAGLDGMSNPQLATQMSMPMALGLLLGPGVKGAFCAVALFGFIAAMGVQLQNFGGTFLQDVLLPLRKKPLAQAEHVRWLRYAALGIAVFACGFSVIFKPVDYLVMLMRLVGAVYLGGVGAVVWGGLYWARGTTAGAWTAMIIGSVLGVVFNLLQQFWTSLAPWVAGWLGSGGLRDYLLENAGRCPFNGALLVVVIAALAFASYIVVSLLTCREPFNLDKMLHRGEFRDPSEAKTEDKKFRWSQLVGLDDECTRGDRLLVIGTFLWGVGWKTFSLCVLMWTLFVGRLPDSWWFGYATVTSIYMPLVLGVLVTVWFTWGGIRDLRQLLHDLKNRKVEDDDDGTVGHPS